MEDREPKSRVMGKSRWAPGFFNHLIKHDEHKANNFKPIFRERVMRCQVESTLVLKLVRS